MTHGRCGGAGKAAERTFCGELVSAIGDARVVRVTGVNRRQAGRSYVKCPHCLAALDRLRKPPVAVERAPSLAAGDDGHFRLRIVDFSLEIELGKK